MGRDPCARRGPRGARAILLNVLLVTGQSNRYHNCEVSSPIDDTLGQVGPTQQEPIASMSPPSIGQSRIARAQTSAEIS